MSGRRIRGRVAGLITGLVLVAVGLEIGARLTDTPAEPAARRINWARRETNTAGFHDVEWSLEKPPGVHRVVVLGDSFTMGEWVPRDESFVRRLERALNEARAGPPRVELLNMALGGMDTRQELDLLRDTGLDYAPDAVLVVFFVNDATHLDSNPAVVRRVRDELEGGRSRFARYSRAWDRIARWFARKRVTRQVMRDYRASFFGDGEQQRQWVRCQRALRGLKRLADEEGIPLGVAIFPLLMDLGPDHPLLDVYERVAETCTQAGLPCVDLFPVFAGRDADELWVAPDDAHPNRLANELVVPALERFLTSEGLVPRVQ